MKRLLFLLVLSVCISAVQARRYYCVIKGWDKPFSNKMTIVLDFGKNPALRVRPNVDVSETEVCDNEGKFRKIYSMVDAMNYMSQFGWTFQQAYTTPLSDADEVVEKWVLYKDAETKEEASEGIYTIEEAAKLSE
ncbi:MAG: hypothetical protein J6R54_11075 [Bacteroidaceae bacterium]|nr:hypothetical protein [Bacteroidaceae bacterium]